MAVGSPSRPVPKSTPTGEIWSGGHLLKYDPASQDHRRPLHRHAVAGGDVAESLVFTLEIRAPDHDLLLLRTNLGERRLALDPFEAAVLGFLDQLVGHHRQRRRGGLVERVDEFAESLEGLVFVGLRLRQAHPIHAQDRQHGDRPVHPLLDRGSNRLLMLAARRTSHGFGPYEQPGQNSREQADPRRPTHQEDSQQRADRAAQGQAEIPHVVGQPHQGASEHHAADGARRSGQPECHGARLSRAGRSRRP